MNAEGDRVPPFLPSTLLHKKGDLCFVHYQTPTPSVRPDDNAAPEEIVVQRAREPLDMTGEVALIRARQETEVVKLIEAHLSEPYTINIYRYFLRQWPHLSILAYNGSLLVGAVMSKLECSDEVCMLHGADPPSEIRAMGSCVISEIKQTADACHCEDARCSNLSKQGLPSPSEQVPPNMPGKQSRVLAQKNVRSTEAALSSYLLCKCQGYCTSNMGMLAVRPEMRGRGIGKQLVQLVLQQQQKLVRVTQAAASAAMPGCMAEQKTICEMVLGCPASASANSSTMQSKLREVRAAVEYAMTDAHSEETTPRGKKGDLRWRPATTCSGKQLPCSLKYCWLEMEAGNTPALRLYTSVGFVVVGYRRRYYCSGKDAYKMQYIFEP